MEPPAQQSFLCTNCGKAIKWTPAIAGKNGRCKCGATIRVPLSMNAPAEEDFLYAVEPPVAPAAVIHAARPQPAANQQPARNIPASRNLGQSIAVLREIWIPAFVLLLGVGGLLAWLDFQGRLFFSAVVVALLAAGATMVIKTLVLCLFAWQVAKSNGGSFGNVPATVLKIAALVVVLDAATLWTWAAMVATGAITPSGQFYITKTLAIMFLSTLLVAALIVQLLYGLHGDEANFFSRFIAGGNLALNVVLLISVTIFVYSLSRSARRTLASAPIPVPTIRIPTPAAPPAPYQQPAVRAEPGPDQKIAILVNQGSPVVFEGRDWTKMFLYRPADKPISAMIEQMYAAGAKRVYVQPFNSSPRVYVDLPSGDDQRAACLKVARQFHALNESASISPDDTTGARFLEIDINR